jgi:hypothetical protein
MADTASSGWRTAYTSALLETDGPKLAIRIAEASAAIKERLNSPTEIERLEHEAIESARVRLGNLKAERLMPLGRDQPTGIPCFNWSVIFCPSRSLPATAGGDMQGISADAENVEQIRKTIRKMSDSELLRYGTACKRMCSPEVNFGEPPPKAWVVQLQEARAEWRRRHENLPLSESF